MCELFLLGKGDPMQVLQNTTLYVDSADELLVCRIKVLTFSRLEFIFASNL